MVGTFPADGESGGATVTRTPPSATVVIPTYDREHLLDLTLSSLVAQSRQDVEVVVVDDGSTDATKSVVERFVGRLDLTYVFQPDEGFRVARARNRGIRLAEAPVVVFVDSGVILHPQAVEAHLRAQDGADVVVGRLLGFRQDDSANAALLDAWSAAGGADFPALEQLLDLRDPREQCFEDVDVPFASWPAPWALFWTANVSVATGLLRAAGCFDEAFTSWGVEDTDLGYRLHRAGGRYRWCHDAVGFHHPHDKPRRSRQMSAETNRRYLARKFPDDPAVQLLTTHRAVHLNSVLLGRLPTTQGIRA